jgi:fumarylacetoacetase
MNKMGVKGTIPTVSPLTIRNIPFGVISTRHNTKPCCATAIGDYAVDLAVYSEHGHLDDLDGLPLETSIVDIFAKVTFVILQRNED